MHVDNQPRKSCDTCTCKVVQNKVDTFFKSPISYKCDNLINLFEDIYKP